MTQPNFLQVRNALAYGATFSAAHPKLLSSQSYGEGMVSALEMFEERTTTTDTAHTHWRAKLGVQLRAFRELRVELERVREVADEHECDGFPDQRIFYTEEGDVTALVQKACAFLAERADDWAWITPAIAKLQGLIAQAEERERETESLYQAYRIEVKRRVAAYTESVAFLRDYYKDAHREAKAAGDFDEITMHI